MRAKRSVELTDDSLADEMVAMMVGKTADVWVAEKDNRMAGCLGAAMVEWSE